MNVIEKIIKVIKGKQTTSTEICDLIQREFIDNTCRYSIHTQIKLQTKAGLLKKEIIEGKVVYSLNEGSENYVPYTRRYVGKAASKDRIVGCYVNGKLVASRILRHNSAIISYQDNCKRYFGECEFIEYEDLKAIPIKKTLNTLAQKNLVAGIKKPQTDTQRATNWFINSTGNQIDFMLKNEGIPKIPNHKEQKEVILMLYNKYSQSYSNL